MKIGDTIKIDFHAVGLVTTEEEIVLDVNDETVTIDAEDERCQFKFNRKTGECLNDNTFGGGKRMLNSDHIL